MRVVQQMAGGWPILVLDFGGDGTKKVPTGDGSGQPPGKSS